MLAVITAIGAARGVSGASLVWSCLLGLCLALSGCAGLGAGATNQPLANDCVWTLTIKDPALAASVAPQIKDGRSFIIEGRRLARDNPAQARQDLGCPALADLPHGLVEEAARLELGQVAGPMAAREGSIWVMRGSDRDRLLGQAQLERQRYPEAMEAAQRDLALNPASVGSWLVLGQARLARGDPSRALQAFEQGLLVDPLEPRLRAGRDQARQALAQPAATPVPPAPARTEAPSPPPAPLPAQAPPSAPALAQTPSPERPVMAPAAKPLPIQTKAEPETPAPPPSTAPESAATAAPGSAEAQALLDQARQAEARGDRRAATLAYHRAARLEPANETAKEGMRRNFLALDLGAGPATPAASPPAPQVKALAPAPATPVPPVPAQAGDKPKPRPAGPPVKVTPATPASPPAPPQKTAPREIDGGKLAKGVYLQVASRRDQAVADQEAKQWKRRQLPVQVSAWKARDGVVWWRVLLGPYPDRQRAQAAGQRLQRQGALDFHLLVEVHQP